MFKPAGPKTLLRPNWRQPKKLPKPLVAVFVLIQLFYGINYGFFTAVMNRRLRALSNFGSTLNTLLIMTAYVYHFFRWDWGAVLFAIYYLCVFLTIIVSNYTMYNFVKDLMAIDDRLNFEMNSYIGFKTSVFLLFAFGFKVSMSVIIGSQIGSVDKEAIFLLMYVIYELRNFLPIVLTFVNIFIFNVIYLRLKFLKVLFEQRGLQIKEIAMIFKALADCLSKIRVSQDTLVVLEFIANFIKCVALVWGYLKMLKESPNQLMSVLINVETVLLIILICLPAVFAELMAATIDQIKLLANERLLVETNDKNRKQLLHLLRYVEARPLVHKAWRLVPVDLRLPVSLLSMSATYLIVLVQLTHLY